MMIRSRSKTRQILRDLGTVSGSVQDQQNGMHHWEDLSKSLDLREPAGA